MSASFNVLTDPWIPVVDFHGRREELGILPLLERAHELQGISDASPLVEFGLYRLLFVFLTDALRPSDETDLLDLLDAERFDMEKIRDYVTQCQAEGASFDLFDEKRPFLQTPYEEQWDKEILPASIIDFSLPHGQNHLHFSHKNPSEIELPFSECARLLTTIQLFCWGARGYKGSINGKPPFYIIVRESNLFRTLLFGLGLSDEIDNLDSPPSFWRSTVPVETGKTIHETSWLYGMLFPVRRVLLVPEPDKNTVRTAYYGPGLEFADKSSWRDPFVSYKINKNGAFPILPKENEPIWRNLAEIADISNKQAATVMSRYARMDRNGTIAHLTLYGVYMPQTGKYEKLYCHSFKIPTSVASRGEAIDTMKSVIQTAARLGDKLLESMNTLHSRKTKNTFSHFHTILPEEVINQAMQTYFDGCEKQILSFCRFDLADSEVDLINAAEAILARIVSEAEQAFDDAVTSVTLSGREMAALVEGKKEFNKEKSKALKVKK